MELLGDNLQGGNLLIPQGLLQNVETGLYQHSRRHGSQEGTLSALTATPSRGIVIAQPPRVAEPFIRSRTPDYDVRGRAQLTLGRLRQPSEGAGGNRYPWTEHASPVGQLGLVHPQMRGVRASSINVATLLSRSRTNEHMQLTPAHTFDPLQRILRTQSRQDRGSVVPLSALLERNDSAAASEEQTGPPEPRLGQVRVHHPSITPVESTQRPSVMSGHPQATREPILRKASVAIANVARKIIPPVRKSSIADTFDRAKLRQVRLERSTSFQLLFRYSFYLLLLAIVYFVLVGRPLWGGVVWYIYILFEYHLTFVGGSAIFVGLAFFYAFGPLLVLFEKPPPAIEMHDERPRFPSAPFIRLSEDTDIEKEEHPKHVSCALLIPCYKSAALLPTTLTAALKVFPKENIFVLNNANTPTPPDNTGEVCEQFEVNHIWIPVGSKIVAQYVGSYIARNHNFATCLLIDDDCILPPNFPIVSNRLNKQTKCLGYTIASIGPNRSKGNWCQQAQDLEYKLSGLQRLFAGVIGSATFPHGAIVLWDTLFLIETFKHHPGFSVSEDWFFGHVARKLGSRITMCSSVFVETETPANLLWAAKGGARGGFGEMTVFKQRFKRWNFFFVNGAFYNLAYIFFSWRLGWREIGAKIFVFQEVYETFLYLVTPIVLPISFIVRPVYTTYLFAGTLALYLTNSIIFNEIHLTLVNRRVSRSMLVFYYMPMKLVMTAINIASCYWALWQYAKYFAKRHPKIIEDTNAVGVVLKIQEEADVQASINDLPQVDEHDFALEAQSLQSGRNSAVPSETSGKFGSLFGQTTDLTYQRRPRRYTVTAVKVDVMDRETSLQNIIDRRESSVSPTNVEPESLTRLESYALPTDINSSNVKSGQLRDEQSFNRIQWYGGHRSSIQSRKRQLSLIPDETEEAESVGYSYYGN